MATVTNDPSIEQLEGTPARLARNPRVRVSQLIMDHLDHGWSAEELCHHYDYPSLAEARAVMLHYRDHAEKIDREIAEDRAAIEATYAIPPSPMAIKLRAIRDSGGWRSNS